MHIEDDQETEPDAGPTNLSLQRQLLAEVGARVAVVRGSYNQAVFAASIGISVRTLQRIEAGERAIDAGVLAAIFRVHGITPDWIILGSKDPRMSMVCPPPADGNPPQVAVAPHHVGVRRAGEEPPTFQLVNTAWAPIIGAQPGQVIVGVVDTQLPRAPTPMLIEVNGQRALATVSQAHDPVSGLQRYSVVVPGRAGIMLEGEAIRSIGRVTFVASPASAGPADPSTQQGLSAWGNPLALGTASDSD